jgi:hypothetical protein
MIKELLKYTYKFFILYIIGFYLLNFRMFYELSFKMIFIIPLNFFLIKYGILKEINKDHYMTKYYILGTLMIITSLFITLLLIVNKTNIFVILFTLIIHVLELLYLDAPDKKNKASK